MNLKAQFNAPSLSASVGNVTIQGNVEVKPLSITENGTYSESGVAYSPVEVNVEGLVPTGTLEIAENGTFDVTDKAAAHVAVKTWDNALTAILDGSATELRDLPSGLSKIKPYAFYNPVRKLPSGYTEVEYLQAVGDTYIDTGIVSNGKDRVEEKVQRTANQDAVQSWFGSMESSNLTRFSIGQYKQNVTRVFFGGYNATQAISDVTTDVITLGLYYSDGYFASLNSEQRNYQPVGSLQPTITSYIFARHGANGVNNTFDGGLTKIFYHRQWDENGNPKLLLTPCKRNSDGRLGFYDSVSNSFLTNSQGNLISGAELPSGNVDSIESADLSVTEIGAYAFFNNVLSSLTLRADEVVVIEDHALDGTSIASGTGIIYVPASLVSAYEAQYPSWTFEAIL